MKKSQSGFTLVEIAIVLVIIGLLLGGVLKGQSMVENARVKALANDFRNVQAMLFAYQDKYRAIPGDDVAAADHQSTATQATGTTTGDGLINTGTWVGATSPAATDESSLFWQHVRLANLATGANTIGQATNAIGGRLGITSATTRVTSPTGIGGTFFICSGGINGTLAQQLDIAMDDGVGTSGNMFGAEGAAVVTATAAIAYDATKLYTVCLAF